MGVLQDKLRDIRHNRVIGIMTSSYGELETVLYQKGMYELEDMSTLEYEVVRKFDSKFVISIKGHKSEMVFLFKKIYHQNASQRVNKLFKALK